MTRWHIALLLAASAAIAVWVFRRGLPHDEFPRPLPNVEWPGW